MNYTLVVNGKFVVIRNKGASLTWTCLSDSHTWLMSEASWSVAAATSASGVTAPSLLLVVRAAGRKALITTTAALVVVAPVSVALGALSVVTATLMAFVVGTISVNHNFVKILIINLTKTPPFIAGPPAQYENHPIKSILEPD
jgi:hypothetical protein